MTRFLSLRFLQALIVVLVMSFVVYGLIGLMPGDPIDIMLSGDPNMTAADAARLRALYGVDKPIIERYFEWLRNAVGGDFGYSRQHNQPVLHILLPRLVNTLYLMMGAFLISVIVAIPAGVYAARHPRSLVDQAINLFCFAGISVPVFFLALLLIILFAVQLGILPASGTRTVGAQSSFTDQLRYLALPVLTLTIANIAQVTRYVRSGMIEVLREDYIRTARAKGADENRVVWKHALRNALIPTVTIMALECGTLLSGALITETMFAYLGMGKLIFDSILANDYNVALVGLLFACSVTLLLNLIADVLYAALDPRISYR
ncbi:MAG: ABC transporter permease [Alphaproteobacteria bacterium]|nr:ABC transporter permease [Alphaproteobacteria bacterium]